MFEVSDAGSGRRGDTAGGPDLGGLERMPPGPELAGLLERVDPAAVSDAYDLVELVAACRRIKAWADGIEIETAAALAAGTRSATTRRRPGTGSRRSGPPAS